MDASKNGLVVLQQLGFHNMLLSIITVLDDQNLSKHRLIVDDFESASMVKFCDNNEIEFLTCVLNNKDILNITPEGRISGYEHIIKNGVLKTAKGKYVWVIPAFYRFHFNTESIRLLIHYLKSDVDSIAISNVINKDNNFLFLYSFETIATTESGENFRFILRKSDYINIFSNKKNFGAFVCHLTAQNVIRQKVPSNGVLHCNIVRIKDNFSHQFLELFSLSNDAKCLTNLHHLNVIIENIRKMNILNDKTEKILKDFIRHYLFSICSELKKYLLVVFENNSVKEDKTLACSAIRELIAMLNHLTIDDLAVHDNARNFSNFLLSWMELMCGEDTSPNIFSTDRIKSPLDPVWYLGENLKDRIYENGKRAMGMMHVDLVHSVEQL
jgi:hypothetical protein